MSSLESKKLYTFFNEEKMKSLENQTIVITGATSGLGLSLAIQAVQEKANVVLLSRCNNALEKVAAKLKLIASENTKIEYFAADLSNQKDLEKTWEQDLHGKKPT